MEEVVETAAEEPKPQPKFYELEICEQVLDRSKMGDSNSSSQFRAELRFLESPNSAALYLVGPWRSTRAGAELDLEMVPFKPTKREMVTKDGISTERAIPEPLP